MEYLADLTRAHLVDDSAVGPARDYVGYGSTPPTFEWPGGARIAVSFVLNYEEGSEYSLPAGDGRQESMGESRRVVPDAIRDLRTESVFEYGSRAGVWRLLRLFDHYNVPLTVFATATAIERNPPFGIYLTGSPHEVCAHGWRWSETWNYDRDEERRRIVAAVSSIERSCGRRPVGWNCRNSATVNTRELLAEVGGFLYDSDAYNDDLPYIVDVHGCGHVVIPYTVVYNDMRYVSGATLSSPTHFTDVCRRGLEYLWEEGKDAPRMMSIGLHARYSGQAARTHALRDFLEYALAKKDVWFATRAEIARFWREINGLKHNPEAGGITVM